MPRTRTRAAQQPSILDDYMTPDQLCAELGIHPFTLYRWNQRGKAPPKTWLGKRVVYRKAGVMAWLESQERPSA